MASQVTDSSSYLGSVGPYPTAPDVSHEAFLNYMIDSGQLDPQWRSKWLRHLAINDPSEALVDLDQWYSQHALYDSWSQKLLNQYASDQKTWEAAHNSPLSASELLESAGYNRNWLQGAAQSQVQASDYLPTQSEGVNFKNDPMQVLGSLIDASMSALQQAIQIRDVEANIDLKEAQATEIRQLLPFKKVRPYFDAIEKKRSWFGPEVDSNMYTLDFGDSGDNIYLAEPGHDNYASRMMLVAENGQRLRNISVHLSNQQRSWVISTLQPFQEKVNSILLDLQTNAKTISDLDVKLRQAAQPMMEKYAGKGIEQQYILNYVNATLNGVKTIADIVIGAKGLNLKKLGLDMDWMDSTGEVPDNFSK